jgi:hypothetical protein
LTRFQKKATFNLSSKWLMENEFFVRQRSCS